MLEYVRLVFVNDNTIIFLSHLQCDTLKITTISNFSIEFILIKRLIYPYIVRAHILVSNSGGVITFEY